MKKSFAILFALALLFACKKNTITNFDLGQSYYPTTIGAWQSYAVEEYHWSDVTSPPTIDSFFYELKENIESEYLGVDSSTHFRIVQSRKTDSTQWVVNNVFSLQKTAYNITKVENDLKFVKLIFPPKANATWQGHHYISTQDEPTIEYLDNNKYKWQYTYTAIDEQKNIGEFQFDSCITIVQIDEENLFEKKYSKEVYAKNIGLVYKEIAILSTQQAPASVPFEERTDKGFVKKYTITAYGK